MKKTSCLWMCGLMALSAAAETPRDANNDGKLSKEEYIAYRQKIAEKNSKTVPPVESLEKAFTRADLDGDGFLSKEEQKKASAVKG